MHPPTRQDTQTSIHMAIKPRHSLSLRITCVFFLLLLSVLVVVVFITQNTVHAQIVRDHNDTTNEIGEKVVAQLGQLTLHAKGLSHAIAQLGSTLPHDDTFLRQSIAQILNVNYADAVVAGGGIWPEPYTLFPQRERASYFWSRQQDGSLTFSNEYNNPQSPNYVNASWYTPSRFLKNGQSIWSGSFTDQYSKQMLVTCSTPYFIDGVFSGISCVDLKLSKMHDLFAEQAKQLDGYIFAVDRNNRFLTYPDSKLVEKVTLDEDGETVHTFINTQDLAARQASFAAIAQHLEEINTQLLAENVRSFPTLTALSKQICAASSEISPQQGQRIAGQILAKQISILKKSDLKVNQFDTDSDLLMHEAMHVRIYNMPQTGWKVIVATPISVTHAIATSITRSIVCYLLAAIALCIGLTYFLLRQQVITPLRSMTRILIKNESHGQTGNPPLALPENRSDELGQLAHWYNRSTDAIRTAHHALSSENHMRLCVEQELRQANQAIQGSLESLRSSEASLAAILNSVTSAVIATDQQGIIIRCNPVVEQLTGWPQSEALTLNVTQVLTVYDESGSALALFEDVTFQQRKIKCQLRCRDFVEYTINLRVAPLFDDEHVQSGYLFIFDDISKEHELEQQLLQSQKMESIGQLAGGIAHDFNNLLAGICGFADLIRIHNPDEKNQRYATRILSTAQKANDLTAQLLAFSRRGHVSNRHLSLHQLIDETVSILERTISKDIIITQQLDAQDDHIFGDSTQLQNMLLNMGINARDAMEHGGTITLASENTFLNHDACAAFSEIISPGNYIKINITDTGSGIDPETLQHIFEPFFTTKPLGKGTGLGLAAVYGIVSSHHGALQVSSMRNTGTTFTLYLPCSETNDLITNPATPHTSHNTIHDTNTASSGQEPAVTAPNIHDQAQIQTQVQSPAQAESNSRLVKTIHSAKRKSSAQHAPAIPNAAKPRLLLIDDEDSVRIATQEMLQLLGFHVDQASSGHTGIAHYRQHHYDLVILDLMMPDMSSLETLRQLLSMNPQLKIIIASGYSSADELDAVQKMGITGFIQKPFQVADLQRLINTCLNSEADPS